MALHDFFADGQADPGARVLGLGVKALEDDKDAVIVFGRNADARSQTILECVLRPRADRNAFSRSALGASAGAKNREDYEGDD